MKSEKLKEQLMFLVVLRVGAMSVIIFPSFYFLRGIYSKFEFSVVIGTYLLILIASLLWLFLKGFSQNFLLQSHLFLDLLAITFLTWITGGSTSDLAFMYLLPIGVATFFNGLKGGLFFSLISVVFYGFFIPLEYQGILNPLMTLQNIYIGGPAVRFYFYTILFFLVGTFSGWLNEVIKKRQEEFETLFQRFSFINETLRTLSHQLGEKIVLVVANNGDIHFKSNKFSELFNHAEMKNILLLRDSFPDLFKVLSKHLATYSPEESKITMSLGDSNFVEFKIYSNPLYSNGRKVGTIFVLENLTETKNKETELKDRLSLYLLSGLVEFVGHEIRTPLTAILGISEIISPDMETFEFLRLKEMMKKEAERLKSMMSPLFETYEVKHNQLEKEELDALRLAVDISRNIVLDESIDFEIDTEHTTFKLYTNRDWFKRILEFLINNSYRSVLKESVENPKIIIRFRKEGEHYTILGDGRDLVEKNQRLIIVEDNGKSEEELRDEIFYLIYGYTVEKMQGSLKRYRGEKRGNQYLLFLPAI